MNVQEMARQAQAMVEAGTAKNFAEAVQIVTRAALDRIAGTYTVQAENYWLRQVNSAR